MKEKKNRQFAIKLERGLASSLKQLSARCRLPMGEIVRLCVEQQLREKRNLKELAEERKTLQLSVRFEDALVKNLSGEARRTGLPLAEIVRLCLTLQLARMNREGSIKIKLSPEDK